MWQEVGHQQSELHSVSLTLSEHTFTREPISDASFLSSNQLQDLLDQDS